jgi:ornithine decarboxylase
VYCFRPESVTTATQFFIKNFPGKVFYAVKANPAPAVIDAMLKAGLRGFDCASLNEIEQIFNADPTAEIAFMHPVKSRKTIEKAYFEYGVRIFAFDCMDELEKILTSTNDAHDLTLVLRLAVPNSDAQLPLSGKFGAHPDQAHILLKAARVHAARLGISFHVGSQTMSPDAYTNAVELVGGIIMRSGIDLEIVDIGGGFPSVYPGMQPPALMSYMKAIKNALMRLPNAKKIEFWSEPGRALVAESTSLVAKVELRKDGALYINDGTYGSLFDAGHCAFKYPVRLIRTKTPSKAPLAPFSFYGPTCDSIDTMKGPFYLPNDVREGDYIEIGMMGAYGQSMRTDFNGFYQSQTVITKDKPMLTMYRPHKGQLRAISDFDMPTTLAS